MRMRRKKHLDERLTECPNLRVLESEAFYKMSVEEKTDIMNLTEIFGNDNPLELEFGCGKGKFIIESAKLHPEINYIAVEKLSNVIVVAAERALAANIKNLLFLNLSVENAECFIPQSRARRIYLNFSCPYPKNSYANRRLTYHRFLEIYRRLLAKDGEIWLKTDNRPFFDYSVESFKENGYLLKNISYDLHKSGFAGNITTEYEERFTLSGFPIYRLEAYLP